MKRRASGAHFDKALDFFYELRVMRPVRTLLLVGSLGCASTPEASSPSQNQGLASDWEAALEDSAQALVASGRAVSVSVAAVNDGQRWSRAYGEAAPNASASVNETFYEVGSVTKVFTSLLLADAIERGEVAPNATIEDLAPDLKLPSDVAAIELQALANHSSGLPRMPSNFAPGDGSDPYVDYDLARLWDGLAQAELGTKRYAYSNFGMAVLGQLLARRAGTSYASLLQSRVLEPLGLEGMRLGPGKGDAQGHDDGGAPKPSWRFDAFAPAGAIRATAPQMLRFVRAHIEAADDEGTLAAAMGRIQTRTAPVPVPGQRGIGLGWHIDDGGHRWHNGQTLGAHSFVGMKPGAYGVVVLANSATADVDRLGRGMLDILDGKEVDLSFTAIIDVPRFLLERYVGEYAIQPNFSLTITVREGRLYVQGTGQPAIPLTAIGEHTFEISALQASGRFILPENGPAKTLIWNQGGQSVRADRVD